MKSSIDEAIVLGRGTQSEAPVTEGAVSASYILEELNYGEVCFVCGVEAQGG